ncbi:MAG: DUF6452 family protein [Bacteroidota bacterium]
MRYLFSAIIVFIIVLISCDEKPCYEDMDTFFRIGFYTVEENQVVDSVLDSLIVYADGSNFGLIFRNTKTIYSELSPNSDTTLFFLTLNDNNGDDFIQLGYNRKYHLVSHDCGFVTYFENLEIIESSDYFIDSVVIVNDVVNDVNQEHIKIFL